MALRTEDTRPGLTNATVWNARKVEESKASEKRDELRDLSEDELRELEIARYCRKLLAAGVRAREPYETFDECWDAYIGDLWPSNMPPWKAKITINKIRAFIHFMQSVMTDNKPRITVQPVLPRTENAADLLTKLVDRHWDKTDLLDKNALAALYGLIWGTGIVKSWYDPSADGGRGKHLDEVCAPYRVYVNRGAKGVEDARFIIHIEPAPLGWVYDNFPEKARVVKRFRGAKIRSGAAQGDERDFLNEGQTAAKRQGIVSPLKMAGNANTLQMPRDQIRDALYDDDQDEIEVAEFWFRDETEEVYQRHKYDGKNPVMEDVLDADGLPVLVQAGVTAQVSPLDGMPFAMPTYKKQQRPVMEKALRKKYPNGRLVIMAGPVVLRDIPNPYQIDGFPFSSWKDQDVGVFWGQGEPPQLKQMNIGLQRIVGQIYDNLNLTGNTSYLVQKDSGLNYRTWKNKPGSLLPVDDIATAVKKLEQGSVPQMAMELVNFIKGGLSEIAGINDALMGGQPPSNTAFATIDQLQESSAAIIRQKVRNFERMLKRQGMLRVQLIQQFESGEQPLRLEYDKNSNEPWTPVYEHDEHGEPQHAIAVVPPASDVEVQFRYFNKEDLQGKVEFSIVPDSSLSTSPAGLWNRYVDLWKNKLIDPVSFHERMKLQDWRTIVKRLMAMQSVPQGKSKPGPAGRTQRSQTQRPSAPGSHVPSRERNALVR